MKLTDSQELAREMGQRLRQRREKLELSQRQVAIRLGVERNTVTAYESGTNGMSAAVLQKLGAILKIHPGYFFGEVHEDEWASEFIAGLEGASPPLTDAEKRYVEETVRMVLGREGR